MWTYAKTMRKPFENIAPAWNRKQHFTYLRRLGTIWYNLVQSGTLWTGCSTLFWARAYKKKSKTLDFYSSRPPGLNNKRLFPRIRHWRGEWPIGHRWPSTYAKPMRKPCETYAKTHWIALTSGRAGCLLGSCGGCYILLNKSRKKVWINLWGHGPHTRTENPNSGLLI